MADDTTVRSTVPAAPHGGAVSGVLFAVLYAVSLICFRTAVPAEAADPGTWLSDPFARTWVRIGLQSVPFTGIAFLWFMASLRNHIGLLEDRFFSTVFFGSGLLFLAMLLSSAAVTQGLLTAFPAGRTGSEETWRALRSTIYSLMNTFGMRMAAVFIFVTSTIGLRTRVLAREISMAGYASGLVLLVVVTSVPWLALVFPAWILLISLYLLIAERRVAGH